MVDKIHKLRYTAGSFSGIALLLFLIGARLFDQYFTIGQKSTQLFFTVLFWVVSFLLIFGMARKRHELTNSIPALVAPLLWLIFAEKPQYLLPVLGVLALLAYNMLKGRRPEIYLGVIVAYLGMYTAVGIAGFIGGLFQEPAPGMVVKEIFSPDKAYKMVVVQTEKYTEKSAAVFLEDVQQTGRLWGISLRADRPMAKPLYKGLPGKKLTLSWIGNEKIRINGEEFYVDELLNGSEWNVNKNIEEGSAYQAD